MPRPVNFCPYCGTAQHHVQDSAPVDAAGPQAGSLSRPEAVAAATSAAASAAAALSGWSDAPAESLADAPSASNRGAGAGTWQGNSGQGSSVQGGEQPDAGAAAPDKTPPGNSTPTPGATGFGRSGTAQPASNQGAGAAPRSAGVTANASLPPRQEVPRPPIPARPQSPGPQGRQPVQLRWWILALAILWGVWLLAKPSARKIERQIDHAAELAKACKGSEAQAELIALRSSRATPEQLAQLQKTLNDQSAICTKRRQRNKAWVEASTAAESALAAGSVDKARTRLNGFIRRWGEDGKTRELKERIDARREDHPLAVPPDRA